MYLHLEGCTIIPVDDALNKVYLHLSFTCIYTYLEKRYANGTN